MSVDIRPARASDLDALVSIEQQVFTGDRITRRGFGSMLGSASAALLVAVRGEREVDGYCAVLFRSNSRAARLYSVAARPGVSGVGRSLLAAAEALAEQRERHEIRLEVREDNRRAIDLYTRNGYGCFAAKPGYYDDGMTALRFHKFLGNDKAHAANVNAAMSRAPVA